MPSLAEMFPNLVKTKKDESASAPEPARVEQARATPRRMSRSSGEPTLKVGGPKRARRSERESAARATFVAHAERDVEAFDPGASNASSDFGEAIVAPAVPVELAQDLVVPVEPASDLVVPVEPVRDLVVPVEPASDPIARVEPEPDSYQGGERRGAGERRSGAEPRSGRERRFSIEARSGSDRRAGEDPRTGDDLRSGEDRRQKAAKSEGFSPLASAARFGVRKVSSIGRSGEAAATTSSAAAAASAEAETVVTPPAGADADGGKTKAKRRGKPARPSLGAAPNLARLRSIGSLKNVNVGMPRRGGKGATLVGLDIQPGYIAAVEADVNGVVAVKRALGLALPPETMREGDLLDPALLSEALRELFSRGGFGKRVRVGLANQRVVVRTIELPPIEDRKELAAAVNFSAQDQIPMPLANAVLDFQPLGIVETPAGRRQRVVVVAAQREMVERLVGAVSGAGLRPEAVDLSAFAMIRALHRPDDEARAGAVETATNTAAASEGEQAASNVSPRPQTLFLNVGGLTNLAIADGTTCRFTRAVGGGVESMASALAERRSVPLIEARASIAGFDLARREPRGGLSGGRDAAGGNALPATTSGAAGRVTPGAGERGGEGGPGGSPDGVVAPTGADAERGGQVHGGPAPEPRSGDAEVRAVISAGMREIAGEVRNSLEYHRAQESSGAVERVVVSGSALEISGFAGALEAELGFRLDRRSVASARGGDLKGTPAERLAVAAGLAVEEVGL